MFYITCVSVMMT